MSDGDRSQQVPKATTGFDAALTVTIAVPPSEALRQLYRPLPAEVAARVGPGDHADFVVYTTQNVELRALAVVALTTDVPAPAPEPWQGD
jgi:hypothetical protein